MPAARFRGGRAAAAGGAGSNRERWLLTYADLITLLLAFFVIMYAISTTDIVKYLNLRGALQEAFNVGVKTGDVGQSIQDSGSMSQAGTVSFSENSEARKVESQLEALQNADGRFDEAVQFVGQRSEGLAIALSGTLLFISGSAELTVDGAAVVGQLAQVLRDLPDDIRVEGYTDDIPPGSSRFPTNWELSTARAVTIARVFESTGIAPYRLSAFGYADYRPVAPNDSAANRVRNRRAEIVILYPPLDLLRVGQ